MLRPVLLLNSASCLLFGMIFVMAPAASASFIGDPPELIVRIIGYGLLVNGLHLASAFLRNIPPRWEVLYFVFGDAIWVLVTIFLVGSGIWINNPPGQISAIAVALFVGMCGWLQWKNAPK